MRDANYFSKLRFFLLDGSTRQRRGARPSTHRTRVRRASPFELEPLEPRVLLAADLAAAVQAVQIVPEQAATVLVTNNGPDRASNAPVAVHASQDTSLDASDVSLGNGRYKGT